ncbi:MAG: hypothetical protein OXH00_08660 [Candidatus Poribacteria bacterium]|nr:hypothetical protein [Candidatus Poribacteria bacterium]
MPAKEKVNLAEVLQQNTPDPHKPKPPQTAGGNSEPVNEKIAASRRGKKNISGYFTPEVHRQLRIIAAEEDKNLQEILGEALNVFFQNRGKPPIA